MRSDREERDSDDDEEEEGDDDDVEDEDDDVDDEEEDDDVNDNDSARTFLSIARTICPTREIQAIISPSPPRLANFLSFPFLSSLLPLSSSSFFLLLLSSPNAFLKIRNVAITSPASAKIQLTVWKLIRSARTGARKQKDGGLIEDDEDEDKGEEEDDDDDEEEEEEEEEVEGG